VKAIGDGYGEGPEGGSHLNAVDRGGKPDGDSGRFARRITRRTSDATNERVVADLWLFSIGHSARDVEHYWNNSGGRNSFVGIDSDVPCAVGIDCPYRIVYPGLVTRPR
jgi:hypothetical protein